MLDWPMATKILLAIAASSDCERLFSLSGRLFCKLRVFLTGQHVNFRTCFIRWINQELDEDDQNVVAAAKKRKNGHCVLLHEVRCWIGRS